MRSLANVILTLLVGTILVLVWVGWTAAGQAGRSAQSGETKPANARGVDR